MLVYNVHGLTHLATDAMRFGPLDTFSAFPFESFLGKIKQMLRKPQFPLSQVIRRLSEMHNVLKVDTKLKKCSLKAYPFEFRQYTQFSGIHYTDLYFSINDGDNCIKVGSSYGLIRNICKGPCDESEPVVFFERFIEHCDFFY